MVEGLLYELFLGLGVHTLYAAPRVLAVNDPIRPPRSLRHGCLNLRSTMQVGRMCEALAIKVACLASLSAVKQAERLAQGLHCTAHFPVLRHIWGGRVPLCNRTDVMPGG